ncbi:thiosulfate oxidation carrier protein SoxY [Methylophaga sp. OBS3]|uniref:thiosulfate oxidation carrier protein SoxY n=1 Tax=Methylophaga sp. OBS3 TaxID=2991934 RepID=UPI0022524309|nr:thiosulfate oxidation carrier protein SoxY [Methylophaga sp. OBS3]MCX4190799.1 transcriptional initiation protein Tat [Methylophaga sp. OBS3]
MSNEFDEARRYWLKRGVSAATLAMVASSGLLLPRQVLAHWPRDAFKAETVEDALLALLGEADLIDDDAVHFSVGSPPTYAINGATVPVEINTTLENIKHVALLVEKNPSPLAMSFEPNDDVMLPFKTMLKVAEDSDMLAVIRADDKLYVTRRFVEIDIGGCA